MTTSPNKMSDEELKKEVLTQICLIKYGNTPSNLSSEQLAQVAFAFSDMYQLIKQHREAYAIEELEKAFGSGERGGMDNWGRSVNIYLRTRIAELREKVGRDDTK